MIRGQTCTCDLSYRIPVEVLFSELSSCGWRGFALDDSFDPDAEMEGCSSVCFRVKLGLESCDSWDLSDVHVGGDEEFKHVEGDLGPYIASFGEVGLEETCGFSLFVDPDFLIYLKGIPTLGVPFPCVPLQGFWMEQVVSIGDKIVVVSVPCSNQTDFLLIHGSLVVEHEVMLHPTGLDKIGVSKKGRGHPKKLKGGVRLR